MGSEAMKLDSYAACHPRIGRLDMKPGPMKRI